MIMLSEGGPAVVRVPREVVRACLTCVFWSRNKPKGVLVGVAASGDCQRHAPVAHMNEGGGRSEPVFPWTWAGDWCGDYQDQDPFGPAHQVVAAAEFRST